MVEANRWVCVFCVFLTLCSGLGGPSPESLSSICTVTLNITRCVKVLEKVFSALAAPFQPPTPRPLQHTHPGS